MNSPTLEQHLNILPEKYLSYLNALSEKQPLTIQADDGEWRLLTKTELAEKIEMNGVGVAFQFEVLKLHVAMYREFAFDDFVESNQGKVKLDRIAQGFVFAEEHGDYLYFDTADNCSVWIYYHDGGDIAKVASNFEDLLGGVFLK
jgi:hypothetical protein